ncbi:uncharacterized protein [Onthophagus taurus]|uniref:uncharacterized protein n=1 Tax=Onthophagus taurus TaxID=166361 RepID=UPI0039BE5E65
MDDLICGYTSFWRIPPKFDGDVDKNFEYSSTIYFYPDTPRVVIEDEFIMVECFYKTKLIYTDFFAFVPVKSSYSIRGDNFNVLLMGFDGTSRLNFYRHWPNTKRVLDRLGAEELFGYNKVADASFANQMPLLAGVSMEELNQLCWGNYTSYFDDCSFIWDVFKTNGFVTAYADDTFAHGLFHGGDWVGFRNEHKTDYLFDYFMAEAESKIGNKKFGYFYDCLGARKTYKVFLNYVEKFLERMNRHKLKFFANFFETIMSHDSIFKPKISDPTISEFFNSELMKKTLQDTILIVYSDHGARFGPFRSFSFQGLIEDMLPYISFYFPPSFKKRHKKFYENFKINRHRLTTPYNIHETLLNLLHLNDNNIKSKHYSLFQEIPENRTCDDAKIPLEYCACGYKDRTISTFDSYKSALLIVSTINKITPRDKCEKLHLNKLLHSRIKIVGANLHYTVTLESLPNKGIFQGTVKLSKKGTKTMSFALVGQITRLNRYGEQSLCVKNDIKLKLYCYCKKNFN